MNKMSKLVSILKKNGPSVLAYSGGVDSTFLAAVAKKVLGDRLLAVTAVSETYTKSELADAKRYAKLLKLRHRLIGTKEFLNKKFTSNPVNRCYYCKGELFSALSDIAKKEGYSSVLDASNRDDLSDFRPGAKAKKEIGVISPLQLAGFTKQDIRDHSRKMKLPTWNKPSCACLASRFPYGQEITAEKLDRVGKAEEYLRKLGFRVLRVRHHGPIARIELGSSEIKRVFTGDIIKSITTSFKKLGFTYVTLDLQGFRTGSMNETLKKGDKQWKKR